MSDITQGPCGRFRFEEVPIVKVGLIHLDRKRPWPSCLNPETGRQWSEDMKTRMLEMLDQVDQCQVVRTDLEVTVSDDPSLRSALALCSQAGCDVLVCIQPTISDGRLAPVIAQQWGKGEHMLFINHPQEETKVVFVKFAIDIGLFIVFLSGLVFWASPEEQTGEMISGNSLVGSHLMTATLR